MRTRAKWSSLAWTFALTVLVPLGEPLATPTASSAVGQLIAITEENGPRIAATVWSLNDKRDIDSFLADASEFSDQFRSLVSYAIPDTSIEVACSHSGSIILRGMVDDDAVGALPGETTFAEFSDCAEREFLDIMRTRNGTTSLTIVESDDDRLSFDLTRDDRATVESDILSEPVRGTYSGTTRYAVDFTVPSLQATSDLFSIVGSTPDGTETLEVRAFESSLTFTGGDGYAKSFLGRFEGTSFGGAVIVTTQSPLTGDEPGRPSGGQFKVEGTTGSNVTIEVAGSRVFLYVDADGDGFDDDDTPAIYEWPAFEALADN